MSSNYSLWIDPVDQVGYSRNLRLSDRLKVANMTPDVFRFQNVRIDQREAADTGPRAHQRHCASHAAEANQHQMFATENPALGGIACKDAVDGDLVFTKVAAQPAERTLTPTV